MSQREILAGYINALLNVLGMLSIGVGVVLWLGCVLMAIVSAKDGDWTILLALVSCIGFLLVGIVLAPLVPYGGILPFVTTVLGVSVAYWLIVYR